MFGNLFKKKATPPQTFDLPGMAPTEGLPLLQASLGLTRESWGVAENLPPKLSMLRMIVERSDSEDELPERLLRDPRAGIGAVESYDALTPYGQAIAMLLVSLGNYAGFLGSSTKTVINNAVSHDAAELRSIMYVCRAYERYADDTLVWTPTVGVIQAFDSKVDSFEAPADFDADHAAMCDEILGWLATCAIFSSITTDRRECRTYPRSTRARKPSSCQMRFSRKRLRREG